MGGRFKGTRLGQRKYIYATECWMSNSRGSEKKYLISKMRMVGFINFYNATGGMRELTISLRENYRLSRSNHATNLRNLEFEIIALLKKYDYTIEDIEKHW